MRSHFCGRASICYMLLLTTQDLVTGAYLLLLLVWNRLRMTRWSHIHTDIRGWNESSWSSCYDVGRRFLHIPLLFVTLRKDAITHHLAKHILAQVRQSAPKESAIGTARRPGWWVLGDVGRLKKYLETYTLQDFRNKPTLHLTVHSLIGWLGRGI